MIQWLWLFDFIGLALARCLVAVVLILDAVRAKKENKRVLALFLFILALFLLFGLFSFLSANILIILEIYRIIRNRRVAENSLLKIAFAFILIFVGPGILSLDRIFNIRW